MGAIIVAIMLSQTNLIGLPQIHSFEENSVSSQYLQAGDEIKEINGKHVYSEYDLSFLMARDKDGDGISSHSAAHRLGGFAAQLPGQFPISDGVAVRNLQKQFPNSALKRRTFRL